MTWFTIDQFKMWCEERICCRCEKKATYFPKDEGICYCDEHFPYKEEKEDETKEVK